MKLPMVVVGFDSTKKDYLVEPNMQIAKEYIQPVIELFDFWQFEFYETINMWAIPAKRIEEMLLWFQYKSITYDIDESARHIITRESPPLKIEFFRGVKQYTDLVKNNKFFSHHPAGIEFFLSRSCGVNADAPGMGKTFQIIALMAYLRKHRGVEQFLIVVKHGLNYQWMYEILRYTEMFAENEIAMVELDSLNHFLTTKAKVVVISNLHIGQALYSYRFKKGAKVKKKALNKLVWREGAVNLDECWGKGDRALILDEIHEENNSKSVKHRAVASIRAQFRYVHGTSATPAMTHFDQWYGIMKLIEPNFFDMTYEAFCLYLAQEIGSQHDRYYIRKYKPGIREQIMEKIKSYYLIKRNKKDVPELKTEPIVKPIKFRMSTQVRVLYDYISKEEYTVYNAKTDVTRKIDMLNSFPYTKQVISNPTLLAKKVSSPEAINMLKAIKFENDPRLDYISAMLREVTADNRKLIIYDSHPETLAQLAKFFDKYHPVIISGDQKLSPREKQNAIDTFNDPKSSNKLFLLQYQAMGAGANLNKCCNTIIFFSLPNNEDALVVRQAMERTDRLDSVMDSVIIFLLFDKCLDTFRYARIKQRIKENDSLEYHDMAPSSVEGALIGAI